MIVFLFLLNGEGKFLVQNCFSGSHGGPYEKQLIKALLKGYERQNRPVLNETAPLILTFGITLQQIIDVVSTK